VAHLPATVSKNFPHHFQLIPFVVTVSIGDTLKLVLLSSCHWLAVLDPCLPFYNLLLTHKLKKISRKTIRDKTCGPPLVAFLHLQKRADNK